MIQTISTVQARNNFSDMLGRAYYNSQKFIIKKLDKPFAVLLGIKEYQQFETARKAFFQQLQTQASKSDSVPYSQVKEDITEAIKQIRSK